MSDSTATLTVAKGETVTLRGVRYLVVSVLDLERALVRRLSDGYQEVARVIDLGPQPAQQRVPPRDHDLSQLSERERRELARRHRALEDISRRISRAEMQAIATELGVSPRTIARWRARYRAYGRVSTLLPSRPGGAGKSRLIDAVEKIITAVIESEYLKPSQPTVTATVEAVRRACRDAGLKPPVRRTIQKRIDALDAAYKATRREGRAMAEASYGPQRGAPEVAPCPLSVVQIDHTPLDLEIVDEVTRRTIGRPWLTVLIDLYSRMVLGFHLSLDAPCTASVAMAIAHALVDKENSLRTQKVPGSWPCWGPMRRLAADNAGEFRGTVLREACQEYLIDLDWRPVARPKYGGHIERLCGTLLAAMRDIPGATQGKRKREGGYDPSRDASLTLAEVRAWLTDYIVNGYHQAVHAGIGMPPIARWQRGILGNDEDVGIGLPPRFTDPDRVRLDFMPYEERIVRPSGIVIDHLHYYHDVLRPYIGRVDPADTRRKLKLRFRRDPADISRVYVYLPDERRYFAIPFRNRAGPAVSSWELRDALRHLRTEGRSAVDEPAIFAMLERNRERQEAAIYSTRRARRSESRRRDHTQRTGNLSAVQDPAPPDQSDDRLSPQVPAPHLRLITPFDIEA